MKMAKLQKATLDPTKISGRCGRLKCCLRYEYDTYEALQKELPPVGADVITQNGRHRVLAHEILAQQLLVETDDHRRMLIPATDVLTVLNRPHHRPTPARFRTTHANYQKQLNCRFARLCSNHAVASILLIRWPNSSSRTIAISSTPTCLSSSR